MKKQKLFFLVTCRKNTWNVGLSIPCPPFCCFWDCWRFNPQSPAVSAAESSFNAELWNWFSWSWKQQTLCLVFGKLLLTESQHPVTSWEMSLLGLGTPMYDTRGYECLSHWGANLLFLPSNSSPTLTSPTNPLAIGAASSHLAQKIYLYKRGYLLNCVSGGLSTGEGNSTDCKAALLALYEVRREARWGGWI